MAHCAARCTEEPAGARRAPATALAGRRDRSRPSASVSLHRGIALTRDVEHVAHLARLGLCRDEVARLEGELNHILEQYAILSELDTEAIAPTAQVIELENDHADDEVRPSFDVETALANAPERHGDHSSCPRSSAARMRRPRGLGRRGCRPRRPVEQRAHGQGTDAPRRTRDGGPTPGGGRQQRGPPRGPPGRHRRAGPRAPRLAGDRRGSSTRRRPVSRRQARGCALARAPDALDALPAMLGIPVGLKDLVDGPGSSRPRPAVASSRASWLPTTRTSWSGSSRPAPSSWARRTWTSSRWARPRSTPATDPPPTRGT